MCVCVRAGRAYMRACACARACVCDTHTHTHGTRITMLIAIYFRDTERYFSCIVQRFFGPEPFLGVSWQNIRKVKRWIENQHLVLWRGPCSTQ
jgi:hypothetical protein